MDFTAEGILIPADHPCFEGHFPGHPIFPAVAQIDLLLEVLQERWQKKLTLLEIRKARFPAPIGPNTSLHVSLKVQDNLVLWRIFDNDKIYSTGTLLVGLDSQRPHNAVTSKTQLQ